MLGTAFRAQDRRFAEIVEGGTAIQAAALGAPFGFGHRQSPCWAPRRTSGYCKTAPRRPVGRGGAIVLKKRALSTRYTGFFLSRSPPPRPSASRDDSQRYRRVRPEAPPVPRPSGHDAAQRRDLGAGRQGNGRTHLRTPVTNAQP